MSLTWNVGVGSPATDLRAKLPPCYSQEFHACTIEYERARKAGEPPKYTTYCKQFEAIIRDTPDTVWGEALELMPYCSGGPVAQPKKDTSGVWPALAVIGVMGGLLAIVVNASGARF